MAEKLMSIPNNDTQNYPFSRLQLVVKMCRHSTELTNQSKFTKAPKDVEPTNKKTFL